MEVHGFGINVGLKSIQIVCQLDLGDLQVDTAQFLTVGDTVTGIPYAMNSPPSSLVVQAVLYSFLWGGRRGRGGGGGGQLHAAWHCGSSVWHECKTK